MKNVLPLEYTIELNVLKLEKRQQESECKHSIKNALFLLMMGFLLPIQWQC